MSKPNNKEANIRTYYSEVHKFGQNGEYDKAIKALNKSKYSSKSTFQSKTSFLQKKSFWMQTSSKIQLFVINKIIFFCFSIECNTRRYNCGPLQSGLFDTNIEIQRSLAIHRAKQVIGPDFREGLLRIPFKYTRESIENYKYVDGESIAGKFEGASCPSAVSLGTVRGLF